MTTPRVAARVLLADPQNRVLLLHAVLPDGLDLWMPPGGGLEPGETPGQAAMREVHEETGITIGDPGRCVWFRSAGFGVDVNEYFFFLRLLEAGKVVMENNLDIVELAALRGHRWWHVAEIIEATEQLFVPRALGVLLEPLLAGVLPNEPFEVRD